MSLQKIHKVFKVVQVANKRWFSTNTSVAMSSYLAQGEIHAEFLASHDIVEYKLGHVTYPLPHMKRIFLCHNMEEAQKVQQYFSSSENPTIIVEGIGTNLRKVFARVDYIKNKEKRSFYPPSSSFITSSVDWFLPQKIVK